MGMALNASIDSRAVPNARVRWNGCDFISQWSHWRRLLYAVCRTPAFDASSSARLLAAMPALPGVFRPDVMTRRNKQLFGKLLYP
jgi:hypothetical protein